MCSRKSLSVFSIDHIALPVLMAAYAIELMLALIHHRGEVARDMVVNLSLGIGNITAGFFMKGVSLAVYSGVYAYAFFRPQLSPLLWIAGFLSCDFVIYLYHRLGHTTRLFWAAHVAHHSSLHYNMSTGLRVNFIHMAYRFLFWAPLCLLGIPPWMILFFESLTAIINFLIHAEKVKKLGVLDLIFNTPSNHRVHHASNPEYLNKNMGGILMIFDHLFGTYAPETTRPIYGITHNIQSQNPIFILMHEYRDIGRQSRRIRGFRAKLRFLFGPPVGEDDLCISSEEDAIPANPSLIKA